MSFLNDKTKFSVKTSNLSTVAKFSSTLDDAYFLILANNSNHLSYGCNNSAAVFGASSSSNFEAYIGLARDNVIHKLARFNNYDINLNRNVVVSGNVLPSSNISYDLGSPEFKWRDLYLSGNSIYVGDTILSSDAETGSMIIKNSSNEIAPMVASKLKLISSGTSSNYSVFTSTDYGINLTFYDKDNNEINHLDLGQGDTSMLPEGSNLYYTFERFDQRLLTKTLDDIIDGTSNRYIINDRYSRDLFVTGTLSASNLVVYGDRTTLNTETYQTEQLQISSDTNGPVLTITQLGNNDTLQVYSGSNIALLVDNQGYVGINTLTPQYNLDVNGTANATYFRGDGSQLWNVNLVDRDTSLLAEGSNLYYTSERVGIIATSSNIDTSNYIMNTSNEISSRLTDTSNVISNRLTNTSNEISERLTDTSNLISDRLTDTSNVISTRLTDTSNVISDRITHIFDSISDRTTNLTTSVIAEGSNLYYTVERFDARLLTKTLDDVYNGTSNKYIINDVYNSDLNVTGTLTTSNLIVNGSFTTLDTITYQTKKLEIVSDSAAPSLLVRQSGLSNIMEVYDDSNIVLSVMNDGYVGINKSSPQYALDVNGTLNATYLVGDGVGLFNVNLADRDTSLLSEGSNLYYTAERVGIISYASNYDTSNYILDTSNIISQLMTETSNLFSDTMLYTSNIISTRITNLTTNEIAEGNNLYYTAQRFDDRLDTKTADYVADGTSNRYIVNDIYNSDLTVTGTLTASNLVVSGDITTLNTNTYQTERMEIVSDVDGPALKVTQRGANDLMYVYDDTNVAMSILKGGNVGINTLTPEYKLDVVGTTRATYLIGDASGLSNVNLTDRDTSMLIEGSNLYYTSERVGVIAYASNYDTSNYILETSNYLITTITDTSNILTDTINNVVSVEISNTCNYLILTSNLLITNLIETSNILTYEINQTINTEINTTIDNLNYTSNELYNLIVSTSNELTNLMNNVVSVQVANAASNLAYTSNELMTNIIATSNQLTDTINNVVSVQITATSNFIVETSNILTNNLDNVYSQLTTRIDNLTTNNIPEGSNLYYTDARFDSMLLTKTLDNIRDGTSNRYIINNTYQGDLYVSGTLSTSNMIVNGTTTTLNTTTYQSKKLEIVSDAIGPALKVQQNGIFDIMQVYDDSNLVMSIVNGGKVGINTSNPQYTLDVVGTTRSSYLIGDGAGLTNVNLLDRNTSMLVEGSNLYYTADRVGVIATASNANTSNYILITSNVISDRITTTSNQLNTTLINTSNTLYTNLILSSNLISNNLYVTSNYLMKALIDTCNLCINTSNDIMTNLIYSYNTYTSNFLANSNLLSSNILATSNALAYMIQTTFVNITGNITDTSNTLINNINSTSNDLIKNTSNTFVVLNNNLTNTSNTIATNIPLVYNSLYVNLDNVSNIIANQINTSSNAISINITNNSNLFTVRILDTSNVISTRITDTSNAISTRITNTSNDYASNLTLTSNILNDLIQLNSNQIYTYYNQTSNSLSTDVVYNSNVISTRITNLNLDMIAPGTSNTYIINNIYDANLTITGRLVVDSLDVIDLGLLEINETGEYINTDMKTYVARITSNVLADAPSIIMNASNNFDIYDANQSNYINTKQNIINGAASTITNVNLLPERVVVTNNNGKLVASTVMSSNLEMIASLNAPVQTQINNLNINSSNLALGILDRISFLNGTIGQSTGGTGNNLSTTNVVTTCNIISYDPVLQMKFEDLSDSSKYASKNFILTPTYPAFTNHTGNLILWYKMNGNVNNYMNNVNSNLYLINGTESYNPSRTTGINSLVLNGYTSYTMGMYNNTIVPSGIRYVNDNSSGLTISFWMNPTSIFTGRQYVFSYYTSNVPVPDCSIEAYMNASNLCLSVGKGVNSSVYSIPMSMQTNVYYNITWAMSKNANVVNNMDSTWNVYINGLNYSNVAGYYPLSSNYLYNTYGGQTTIYSSNFFNGYVDDFRVYNKTLNFSEISDNTGMNYPSYDNYINDLLLWYNFDGHLQNYDGNTSYALSLTTGTLSYIVNKVSSLYTVYLNGSTYYSMNTNSAIDFSTVSNLYPNGLTFSFVFNATSVATATQYLFSMTDTLNSTTPTRSIEVFMTTNQLNFRIRQNGTTTMQTVTVSAGLVAYKYYNVTWVISSGTNSSNASWYIYLNGVNVYTGEGDRYYPVTGTYSYNYIGSLYNSSYFTGYVDDMRVYKKALNSDEVYKMSIKFAKYAIFANHTNNLVSWFNFDNDYMNTVLDNTIPLAYVNFNDKKMIAYSDTNNYILYNNGSNITNAYASINNFTSLNTGIAGYDAGNSYALSTNVSRYVYYTDKIGIGNIMKIMNNKGFLLHFAFKADKISLVPLYFVGTKTKGYINVFLYQGYIIIHVGDDVNIIKVITDIAINSGSWYVIDIVSKVQYGKMTMEVYVNSVKQNIICKYYDTTINTSNIVNVEYKGTQLQYGGENSAIYMGGYSPKIDYNVSNYTIGAMLTTTYYSSNISYYDYAGSNNINKVPVNISDINILNISPISNSTFKSYISYADTNKYYAFKNSMYMYASNLLDNNYYSSNSSYFSSNNILISDISSMLVDIIGNIYLDEGYYNFALDLQNEIAAELSLSTINNYALNDTIVVSAYYNGDIINPSNTINDGLSTEYPVKVNAGYYKINLKLLRKSMTSKYNIAKYYKYPSYVGNSVNILSRNVNYINYTSLTTDVKNNMMDVSSNIYINNNSIVQKIVNTNPILFGTDNGVLVIGNNNNSYSGNSIYNVVVNVLSSNIHVAYAPSNIIDVANLTTTLLCTADGYVYSKGYNTGGQLGLNHYVNTDYYLPVVGINGVGTLSGIVQVTEGNLLGNQVTFFLKNDGNLYYCGASTQSKVPTRYSTITNVIQVYGCSQANILLKSDGTAYAANFLTPNVFTNISGIIQVAVSYNNYILLKNDGVPYGHSTATGIGTPSRVVGLTTGTYLSNIVKISGGGSGSGIAVFLSNTSNVYYKTGDILTGTVSENTNLASSNIVDIRSGSVYVNNIGKVYNASGVAFKDLNGIDDITGVSRAIEYNGTVYAIKNGVVYKTSTTTFALETSKDSAKNIIKVYCVRDGSGNYFITKDYTLYYIDGTNSYSLYNINFKVIDICMAVYGGGKYTAFLTKNNTVTYLTNGYYTIYENANTILSDIVNIDAEYSTFNLYMVKRNGLVYNAYVNNYTILGGYATYVSGMTNIKSVKCGFNFSIFLTKSGEIYGLGINNYGQLGTGNNNNASTPVMMSGVNGVGTINNIIKVACGDYYTLLLTSDTTVLATGYNYDTSASQGILGIGSTVSSVNVLTPILNVNGVGVLKGIKSMAGRMTGMGAVGAGYSIVVLLGIDNLIYVNGGANGLLKLYDVAPAVPSVPIQNLYISPKSIFFGTLTYGENPLYYDSSNVAFEFDSVASSNFYIYDSNYTVNIQDVRLYTPEVMGTSNVIVNQLSKGIYTPPSVTYANNIIIGSNTTFDMSTYSSGYASLSFNSSNSSYASFQPNFYDFGSSDSTISMWVKGNDIPLKYPTRAFTVNDNTTYCSTSSFSNVDTWKAFNNNSSTSLNMTTYTQMYSIGYNNVGQLGDNTTANRTVGYVPVIVPAGIDTITQIAGTTNTTGWYVHFLTDTGKVYYLPTAGMTQLSQNYFNGEKITFIASGRSTYFITESGLLYAYGDNSYYQLGNGNNTTQNTPILIPASRWNGEKVVYVATGNYHTFIITESGVVYSIGYNNNGQLGTANTTNQTNWTLFTSLANVYRVYCSGNQTYCITNAGLLYSIGVRGNVPFLESSIPSNKKIIKVSFSEGNCAFALSDDGSVYGYGSNPISMPNTTVAQTSFIEMTSSVWSGTKIVDVVTAGDHTFYTTDKGLVYVVGNNNYGQLNIPTSTASSKTPLLVNVGGAKINLVYGGLLTTGYNIVVTYPNKTFVEFGANKGEFIKYDLLESVAVNNTQISITTPATTTSITYPLNIRLYATNANTAFTNVNVLWDLLGTYTGTLSYSASAQLVNIVPTTSTSYRYYAVLINSVYNININEIGSYVNSSINTKKTIFEASIDIDNSINVTLQSSNITAIFKKNGVMQSAIVSHPNIYNKGILYTLSYKYNTDPSDSTMKVYTNASLVKTMQPVSYPVSGSYGNVVLGKTNYADNGLYNYFTGNIDDFRLYNRELTGTEVMSIYSSTVFNTEGNTANANKFALTSSRNTYVYNVNYNDIYGLLRNIDANGFTIHFLFKTSDVNNSALYYIGGNKTSKLYVKVVSGFIYIMLGSNLVIVSKNKILANTWYTIDLLGNISTSGSISIQLFINGTIQPIYVNNTLYNTNYTGTYNNSLAPDNSTLYGMYIGGNNIINNIYRDTADFTQGAIFTNTYYSCNLVSSLASGVLPQILSRPAVNGADFSNMLVNADMRYSYKMSSNVIMTDSEYKFIYDGSNYLYGTYITSNLNNTNFILTEVDANVQLAEGYYYFVNDVISEITAELYIGTEADTSVNSFTNVANYYSSNISAGNTTILDSLNKTTMLPIYIPTGYYKLYSRVYGVSDRKYLQYKYIKVDGYNGDYYSLVSHNVSYQSYNSIDSGLRDLAVSLSNKLYISNNATNNIMTKSGGSINASMYGWGNTTYVFDNGVINRGSLDTSTATYVNMLSTGQPNGSILNSWSFYAGTTGRSITPLIYEYTSGTNYIVRGIGRSRAITATGVQTYQFDVIDGSNIFLNSNYRFGWRDGTTTTTNQGVIVFDSTNSISGTTYYAATGGNVATGNTLSLSSSLGNRTYAFKLDFVNNNNQFGNYIYNSSNYSIDNVNYTSNYLVPYVPNNLIPQMVYDMNNARYMKGVTSICNGSSHTVVLKYDGSVFACGTNNFGQLGINSIVNSDTFVPVLDISGSGALSGVKSIGCGALWSHFIKNDGTVYGCGINAYGNIGDNTTTQRNRIVQVVGVGASGYLTDCKQVVGGFGTNCVTLFLKNDGTVYGCGNNMYGTIGDNTTTQRNAVVQVLGVGAVGYLTDVKQIAINSTTSVFLKNDGSVYACGGNSFGQIGDNSYTQRNTVVRVLGIAGIGYMTNISKIAANGASAHSLFLRNDGIVYGCGFNGFGQLGRNNTSNLPYPMRIISTDGIGTISGITQIANNANVSYFLKYDGTLMSCGGGDNSYTSNYGNLGQLGNGFTSNILLPNYVVDSTGSNVIQGISGLSVGGINNINAIFNNGNKEFVKDISFYVVKTENENQSVLIQDFRIYNNGSFTSNIINVYGTGNTSVTVNAYSTYNEITDANRWMKSKDYYLYTNGVLNRSIYYTEGNVGIGTSAPTASLEVYTIDANMYSIKTNNAIWAQTGVISSSDMRIKKDIVDIDDLKALEQILKIEPKTYNYIDKNRGRENVYGFIAQQIREVIPNAVAINTESIPNIYAEGKVQDKCIIVFDCDINDKVYVGCMIDVVIADGTKVRSKVVEIVNNSIIRIDTELEDEKVFVYGTVVDDFHTIDKSYIYTLNVCATQDLYRQIERNKNKLDEQNNKIAELMNKLNTLEN